MWSIDEIIELNYIDMEVDIQPVLAKDIEIMEEQNWSRSSPPT